jgi:uncharacterized RDD family membrane protein YckC
MTSIPPDPPGAGEPDLSAPPAGWGDQFGASPGQSAPAPDFGANPYGQSAPEPAPDTGFGAPVQAPPGADQSAYGQQPYEQQQQQGYGAPPPYQPQGGYPPAWNAGMQGGGCPNCGAPVGASVHCTNCNQVLGLPQGYVLASAGDRFVQYLFDGLLAVVTLGIGYLVWSIIIWKDGTTPAMKIMHMRCLKKATLQTATRGTMAVREILGGIAQAALNYVLIGIVLLFMLLWDKDRQQLWDKIAGTIVIKDPVGVVGPPQQQQAALPY